MGIIPKATGLLADLTPSQQNTAFKLADDFENASKDFFKVRDSYNRVLASAQDPSAAGDLSLIFNYMKTLDPNSVVRESEFATAQNSAGVPEIVRAKYNKVISGERLSDATRADFVDRSKKLFDVQLKQQQEVSKTYSNRAEKFGIPSDFVVRDLGAVGAIPKIALPKTDEEAQTEAQTAGVSIDAPEVKENIWKRINKFLFGK